MPTAAAGPSGTDPAPATATSHPLAPPAAGPARRRKPTLAGALVLIGSAVGGGVVAFASLRALDDGVTAFHLSIVVLALLVSIWLQLLVHETGHALAALSRGYRPMAFGVGPLRLERGQAGWRLHVARNVHGIGGFASLLPPTEAPDPRLDDAIYLAGGPLANFLAAAVALALLPWTEPGSASATSLWALAAFGVLIGAVNLVPFTSGGWRSDGLGLLDLWRKPELVAGYRRLQQVGVLQMNGLRPRDWPVALIPELPTADADPHLRRGVALVRLNHALDREQPAPAREAAESLVADWAEAPDGLRQIVAVSLAAHAALVERDAELVDAWLAHADGGLFDLTSSRHWLAAEAAALRGDLHGARRAIAAARAALGRVQDPASHAMLVEALDTLEGRCGPTPEAGYSTR